MGQRPRDSRRGMKTAGSTEFKDQGSNHVRAFNCTIGTAKVISSKSGDFERDRHKERFCFVGRVFAITTCSVGHRAVPSYRTNHRNVGLICAAGIL